MKLYIISDIHGKTDELEKFIEDIKDKEFDNLIILGDIYHRYDYSNTHTTNIGHILSKVVTKLIIIKGNCDYIGDEKYLPVGFRENLTLMRKEKNIYFSHGHKYFPFEILKPKDIYCHGHTHIPSISVDNEKEYIVCCPGSISIPRASSPKTYMIIDDEGIKINTLDHKTIIKLEH